MWHGDYIRRFIEGADGGRDLLIIAQTPGLCRQPQGRLLRAQTFAGIIPGAVPAGRGGPDPKNALGRPRSLTARPPPVLLCVS